MTRSGLDDLAAAQAGRAHTNSPGARPHPGMNRTQIHIPAPLGHIVGVADFIAELRTAAAHFTNSRHDEGSLLLKS